MSQTPKGPNFGSPTEELETIQFPFTHPGKAPKKLCARKGDLMLEVMKWPNPWEFQFQANVFQSASRGGTFVEVGANIGTTTVFAADFFKKCYIFEPSSRNLPILRRNVEINSITNIEIFPMALSNAAGTATMFIDPTGNTGADSLCSEHSRGSVAGEQVPVSTLDAALPGVTDTTLIHIDTEGFDFKVLQGAREFVRRQTQKPVIVIEFDPRALILAGSSIGELISFLDDLKYNVMTPAHNNPAPMSRTILCELFYAWRTSGWIDLYLLP